MQDGFFEILENKPLSQNKTIYQMRIKGDTSHIKHSGEFINIQIDGFFLRRPISICDYDEHTITILYKIVGKGTTALSKLNPPHALQILTGLGNGYDTEKSGERPLLIGGGVGVPPMYHLAKTLIAQDKKPSIILGFQSKEDAFYMEEFKALDIPVHIATVDGSIGMKGFVTDVIQELSKTNAYTYFYTCGPEVMLKAICDIVDTLACPISGQLSFEKRMACGFGACMGCSCETKYGYKRICKEGPVLEKEEIIW